MITFKQFLIENKNDDNVFEIPHYNWDWLVNKINKLNKRSSNLGLPPLKINIISEKEATITKDRNGNDLIVPEIVTYKKIKLEGEGPTLPGWKLIAVINHNANITQNIIDKVPTETVKIPDSYWTSMPECDHCQYNRFRTQTFLIQNTETNEIKQIGRTCLKDFLGHDPEKFLKYAVFIRNFMESFYNAENIDYLGGGNSSNLKRVSLKDFLIYVSHFANSFGYVSVKNAEEHEEPTTKTLALNAMFPTNIDGRGQVPLTEKDKTLADDTIKWVKDFTSKEENITNSSMPEFWRNVKAIFDSNVVSYKTFGYAAATVGMYIHKKNKEKDESLNNQNPSAYVGTIGQKIETTVTVLYSKPITSYYGIVTLYNMEDKNGNNIKWFSSGTTTYLEDGQTYKIKATVKKQEEFKNKKQTIVTRLKLT